MEYIKELTADYLKSEKAEYEANIQKLSFHIDYMRSKVRLWQKHISVIDKRLIEMGELKPEDSVSNIVTTGELTFTDSEEIVQHDE